jgi:exonuclease III
MKKCSIFRFLLFTLFIIGYECSIKIGSWNIQSFGKTKMSRPEVVEYIVKVLSNYDIALIQELKDNSEYDIMRELLNELNYFNKYFINY